MQADLSDAVLYGYWRSSASYRVRIAMALKGLNPSQVPVNLAQGEQRDEEYLRRNPQGFVPMLDQGGWRQPQSLAIIEYLDEEYPTVPLLPGNPRDRAYIRALAQMVACDMHPLHNRRVLVYLERELGLNEAQKTAWIHRWMREGFEAIEAYLCHEGKAGLCCFGDDPTLADVALVPQVYGARRFGVDLASYPRLVTIAEHCERLPAFAAAAPEKQPDAV